VATLPEQFGAVVRRRRLAAGLSQETLAERAGLHFTTISLIERGKRAPTITVLKKLAEGLEVKMSDLVLDLEQESDDSTNSKRKK
jgi:transcriptional regulator with XRE-family HTH domain